MRAEPSLFSGRVQFLPDHSAQRLFDGLFLHRLAQGGIDEGLVSACTGLLLELRDDIGIEGDVDFLLFRWH